MEEQKNSNIFYRAERVDDNERLIPLSIEQQALVIQVLKERIGGTRVFSMNGIYADLTLLFNLFDEESILSPVNKELYGEVIKLDNSEDIGLDDILLHAMVLSQGKTLDIRNIRNMHLHMRFEPDTLYPLSPLIRLNFDYRRLLLSNLAEKYNKDGHVAIKQIDLNHFVFQGFSDSLVLLSSYKPDDFTDDYFKQYLQDLYKHGIYTISDLEMALNNIQNLSFLNDQNLEYSFLLLDSYNIQSK